MAFHVNYVLLASKSFEREKIIWFLFRSFPCGVLFVVSRQKKQIKRNECQNRIFFHFAKLRFRQWFLWRFPFQFFFPFEFCHFCLYNLNAQISSKRWKRCDVWMFFSMCAQHPALCNMTTTHIHVHIVYFNVNIFVTSVSFVLVYRVQMTMTTTATKHSYAKTHISFRDVWIHGTHVFMTVSSSVSHISHRISHARRKSDFDTYILFYFAFLLATFE